MGLIAIGAALAIGLATIGPGIGQGSGSEGTGRYGTSAGSGRNASYEYDSLVCFYGIA